MRSTLTLAISFLALSANAQTLFTEDFETTPAFTLNTGDANSAVSANNRWAVNDVYAGGSAESTCILPVTFDVPATAGQPGGITSANGNYLHTLSTLAESGGIQCCCFAAADGLCTAADNIFARMSSDVSTVGVSEVELRFWWLCQGGNQNYGEVYYSTNGGSSWTQVTTPIAQYRNADNWAEQSVVLPAFADQATLRFGFRFHNGLALFEVADPGFAIDDVRIIGSNTTPVSIATSVSVLTCCQGASVDVAYTISGTFNAGNIFTAQLSDASGSFASPVTIGTLSSVTGGTIAGVIPPGTPPGSGYRTRVVGDSPLTTGSDNGTDITVFNAPYAGTGATFSVCSGDAPVAMDTGGDEGGIWSGPSPVVGGVYDPGTMEPGVYTYTVSSTGPCASDSVAFVITEIEGADAGISTVATICKNTGIYDLYDLLDGSPDLGGTWTAPGGGPSDGLFNSNTTNGGVYTYTVDAGGSCGSDEAVVSVQVGLPGEAGPDDTWSVCSTGLPVDLFSLLDVSANLSGVWFNSNIPFDGNADNAGNYVYIDYADLPCANDTAFITLDVSPAAYAGENSTIEVCSTWPPFDLITVLGGSPQSGGTWTGPDGNPASSSFQPGQSTFGLYTYTVPGVEPCADDEAVVAVVPCVGIGESSAGPTLRWLGHGADGTQTFTAPVIQNVTVEVVDARGGLVFVQQHATINGQVRLDCEPWGPGVYALRVLSPGRIDVVRFVQ
ncbi:MAG: hypothetical protein KA791_01940 [Flavobacteriales bacterium]|nr:hypothetical protein [Flavobacteriales bacterium]